MNIEEIAINYGSIFNDKLKVPQEHADIINPDIKNINITNFNPIDLSLDEFNLAIKSTSLSKGFLYLLRIFL
jgi:hypothetical protein